jgi:alkanesulfonate monooxygenase SsuD/methylene tetrahydromethanopterin reductase-like flavin-dependent oxidoreductase (luciferase family)/predicted kinase
MVGRDESDLGATDDAFGLLRSIVEARCRRRLTTVVDTTGLDPELRARMRGLAVEHSLPCHAVLFIAGLGVAKAQNAQRAKRVPEKVVADQVKRANEIDSTIDSEMFNVVHRVVADQRTTHRSKDAPLIESAVAAPIAERRTSPRFGLQISSFPWPASEHRQRLAEIATAAESAGFDSLWVMDHFRQIPQLGREWDDMHEATTTLAYLAAVTNQVTLGTLVASVTHRNIGVLGKAFSTIDVLSGGRAVCGLGLGWFKAEHQAYGLEFPSTIERYQLLEDSLQALPLLWGKGARSFEGHRFTSPGLLSYPRPLQARIPLLVGGSGERRTLRLAAKFGDACNLFGDPVTVSRKIQVLHAHCEELGRDTSAVEVTHLGTALVADNSKQLAERIAALKIPPRTIGSQNPGTVYDHIERAAALVHVGVQHLIVSLPGLTASDVTRYGEVIEAVRQKPLRAAK